MATGGSLRNLANLKFRWPWFVVGVLAIREAVVLRPLNGIEGLQFVYAAALAGLISWTILHVDRLRGIWIVAAGATMNLLAVAANGGRMPVAPELAGVLVHRGHLGQYVLMGPDTNLNGLADWINVSGPIGIGGAYSPGDLVVALGVGIVAFFATRQRPRSTTKLDATSSRIGRYPP